MGFRGDDDSRGPHLEGLGKGINDFGGLDAHYFSLFCQNPSHLLRQAIVNLC